MRRFWPILITVPAFLALGLGNALRSSESTSVSIREEQARLDAIPMAIGPWEGTTTSISEKELRIAEVRAHISRRYVRKNSNESLQVLLLFGTPGALGAHSPEVCYGGAGFRQTSPPHRRATASEHADFWSLRFETGGLPPEDLDVMWSICADGVWTAPDNPRLSLSANRHVHKLYVARTPKPNENRTQKNVSEEFLELFLQAFREAESQPPETRHD